MKHDYYDVIIVGAGPAGLFAANELKGSGQKVLVIDKGKDVEDRHCHMEEFGTCIQCTDCNIMCGVGGAGTFSDGTLNLRPDVGGELADLCDTEKAWQLVRDVDRMFLEHGMSNEMYRGNGEDIENLKRRAASVGAR
ncbi:Ferredoxin--NADP reductase, partial [ANME-1 cluster archaeon GoMg2]|nr:Ferredoxin--NADP reductase [ANME-1 cluster archaeon GoMg2]